MARTIQVTPEQLESAAGKIEGLAAEYKASYDQMYSTTSDMASSWSGQDNEAFINQIAGFKDDFAKMHTLMLNYADYLRKSAKAYRETQQNVITQARSLQN